jgi:formylglycine-generating enzyme required for sulfatase activity
MVEDALMNISRDIEQLKSDKPTASSETIGQSIIALLQTTELTPVQRAELGSQLAILGDSRPGVGVVSPSAQASPVPDIAWIDIPAGVFVMGSNKEQDFSAKDIELPPHRVDLPAYCISLVPVTYQQYDVFVNDGGYVRREYWTEAGWKWKADKTVPSLAWDDPVFHVANQPVIGVSWYEADAFCHWLSARLGYMVRLPTEAEWEKAARGTEGLIYPYGNRFDSAATNVEASGIGRPCAVAMFPQGASPYGVLDMSGNVFEWTTTRFRPYPYDAADGREDTIQYGSRVFRGGAFGFDAVLARTSFRSHFYPYARYDWVGFRVCRSTPAGADRDNPAASRPTG